MMKTMCSRPNSNNIQFKLLSTTTNFNCPNLINLGQYKNNLNKKINTRIPISQSLSTLIRVLKNKFIYLFCWWVLFHNEIKRLVLSVRYRIKLQDTRTKNLTMKSCTFYCFVCTVFEPIHNYIFVQKMIYFVMSL